MRETEPQQEQGGFSLESNKDALEERQIPWKRPAGQEVMGECRNHERLVRLEYIQGGGRTRIPPAAARGADSIAVSVVLID